MYIIGFIMILFIMIGILFMQGKGSSLIAGFNTLPEEEKNRYNIPALCKFMGKMMFALSFSMIFWIMSEITGAVWLFILGIGLFLGITIFMLIYINTNNRFIKK